MKIVDPMTFSIDAYVLFDSMLSLLKKILRFSVMYKAIESVENGLNVGNGHGIFDSRNIVQSKTSQLCESFKFGFLFVSRKSKWFESDLPKD